MEDISCKWCMKKVGLISSSIDFKGKSITTDREDIS